MIQKNIWYTGLFGLSMLIGAGRIEAIDLFAACRKPAQVAVAAVASKGAANVVAQQVAVEAAKNAFAPAAVAQNVKRAQLPLLCRIYRGSIRPCGRFMWNHSGKLTIATALVVGSYLLYKRDARMKRELLAKDAAIAEIQDRVYAVVGERNIWKNACRASEQAMRGAQEQDAKRMDGLRNENQQLQQQYATLEQSAGARRVKALEETIRQREETLKENEQRIQQLAHQAQAAEQLKAQNVQLQTEINQNKQQFLERIEALQKQLDTERGVLRKAAEEIVRLRGYSS